jgi:hypothetical protein
MAALTAAMFGLLASAGGCKLFNMDRWKLDNFRDKRSVDIERRLERTEPIVKNPF